MPCGCKHRAAANPLKGLRGKSAATPVWPSINRLTNLRESQVAQIAPDTRLKVHCDACPPGLTATVSYVSNAPEFTPPVIYSLESRQKLVYLIEARPDADAALKPGQIADVDLPEAEQ